MWFGPNVWDLLEKETKILLKNLAIHYKTSPIARQERNFGRVYPNLFLKSLFVNDEHYVAYFYNLFAPYLGQIEQNLPSVYNFQW